MWKQHMKEYWQQEIHDFQRKKSNSVVRRADVGGMLLNIIKKVKTSSITNGFRVTGLYPLNASNVDYSKYLVMKIEEDDIKANENNTTSNHKESTPSLDDYAIAKTAIVKELGEEDCNKCVRK